MSLAEIRHPPARAAFYGLLILTAIAMTVIFRDGLSLMVAWWAAPEYQHGYLIPVVSLYMIWARAAYLDRGTLQPSWAGVIVVALGLFGFLAGELSAIYTLIQYSFLLTVWGLVLTALGWAGVRHFWAGLFFLVFMIPLPAFFQFNLSNILQLWSSEIGTWFLRLVGVSVYLEGNVIDLGNYRLQVAEACSGLRYLFPLASFAFFCAYVFRGPLWQRLLIFASAAPIAILMNSFRVGVTGMLVNSYGTSHAEGFLHYFEGWVIFVACIVLLFLEMALLAFLNRARLADAFTVEIPELADLQALLPGRGIAAPTVAAAVLLLVGVTGSLVIENRQEAVPQHAPLSGFPLTIGPWTGDDQALAPEVLNELKLTDYAMVNFQAADYPRVAQLYIAYYASQRKGASVHSPRACLPGGGWQIDEFGQVDIPGGQPDGSALRVNRAVISMGERRSLVYYWFMQRGRVLTNEFMVKWYIFWDSLTRNRTDGAMVRVVLPLAEATETEDADRQSAEFIRAVQPTLYYHIPQEDAVLAAGPASDAASPGPQGRS